jgi:ketosteroid isomerase-like protein
MKALILTLLACGILAAADPKAEKEILDATEAFRQAYMKKDLAALARMTSDELIYVHSSGLRENKDQFLKAVGGAVRFDLTDPVVRTDGNVGVIQFKTDIRGIRGASAADQPNPLMLMMTWTKARDGWKLIGRQAAKIPEPAPNQKK